MSGPRTLLVASSGGHLEEILRLRGRLRPAGELEEFATFDDAHSRSVLRAERVHHVEFIGPRGFVAAARSLRDVTSILRAGGYQRLVSTGAGIAVPFLALGRLKGLECHYIESAARAEGPSLTGKVVARIPGVHRYTQHRAWADRTWIYRGSLFDAYERDPQATDPPRRARRVVVTLGTMRSYPFTALVRRLVDILPEILEDDAKVLWQVGCTDVSDLQLDGHDLVPGAALREAINAADLVIAHGGVGSALAALDAGRCPVLVPRRAVRGEHVDDHQLMITTDLHDRGLAVAAEADLLTTDDLRRALATRIRARGTPPEFHLG